MMENHGVSSDGHHNIHYQHQCQACSALNLVVVAMVVMCVGLHERRTLEPNPLSGDAHIKKSVVSVDLLCSKCKKKVMKLLAGIEGINSIVLDSSMSTATIVGDADPVEIIKKVRKFKRSAGFVSLGPPIVDETKDEVKMDIYPYVPKTCQKCDVWYVVGQEYNHCSIL